MKSNDNSQLLLTQRVSISTLAKIVISLILLAACLQVLAAMRQETTKVPEEYLVVRYAMGADDYDLVHSRLNHLLQQPQVFKRAYELTAYVYTYEDSLQAGIEFLDSLQTVGQNLGEVAGARAILYSNFGKADETFDSARQAVIAGCEFTYPYEIFVAAALKRDSAAAVQDFLQQQLQEHPKRWQLRFAMAELYRNTNRLEQAGALLQGLLNGGKRDWRTYKTLAEIHLHFRQLELAKRVLESGLDYCRSIEDEGGMATLLESFVNVAFGLGEAESARRYSQEAVALAEKLGNKRLQTRLLLNTGEMLIDQCQWREARRYLDQGRRLALQYNQGHEYFRANYRLGRLECELGNWRAAQACYLRAYHIADSLRWDDYLLSILIPLRSIEERVGHRREALAFYKKLEQGFVQNPQSASRATFLWNYSEALLEAGEYAQALTKADTAWSLFSRAKDKMSQIGMAIVKGRILSQMGRLPEATEYFRTATAQAIRSDFIVLHNEAKLHLAEAHLRAGYCADSRKEVSEVLGRWSESLNRLDLRASRLWAAASLACGDTAAAIVAFERTIQNVDIASKLLGPQNLTSLTSDEHQLFFDYAQLQLLRNNFTVAVLTTERARDLSVRKLRWQASLLQELAIDSELIERKSKLDSALSKLKAQLLTVSTLLEKEIIRAQLKDTEQQAATVIEQIQQKVGWQPEEITANDLAMLQEELGRRQEAALDFFVGDSCTLAFVVTSDTIFGRRLDLGETQLRRKMAQVHPVFSSETAEYLAMNITTVDTMASVALCHSLLKDLLAGLNVKNLAIVSGGILQGLPFDMLMWPPDDSLASPQYMIERFAIRNGASLQSLLAGGEENLDVESFVLLANPTLPANFATGKEEVEAVTSLVRVDQILTEQRATGRNFMAALKNANWVHIATHNSYDAHEPWFTEFTLAQPDGASQPEKFQAYQMLLAKTPAQMAVLSGCETALGASFHGEGFEGFVQAFRAAGLPSLIATLWKVRNQRAAYFIKHYYAALQNGMDTVEALRTAKLTLLRDARYSVLDWAAFNYYGSRWQVQFGAPGPWLSGMLLWIVVAFVLIAGLAVVKWTWFRQAQPQKFQAN